MKEDQSLKEQQYNDNEHFVSEPDIPSGESTVIKAAFNMTKTIVGAGVFGLPRTFQNAGFVTAIILIVTLAFIINWTLQVLLRAGLKSKAYSYHDLVNNCFGKYGMYLYSFFAFMFAFGGMCAYTVIIGDTVPVVIRAMFGVASADAPVSTFVRYLTDRRVITVLASYLIMFPVSSVRHISTLARFSMFALVAIVVIASFIIVAGSTADASLKGSQSNMFSILKPSGISGAIGTLCFAYVCHHNTFIVFRSLKYPTFNNFNRVNLISLTYAMMASLVVGISGYVIFTDQIRSNVLNCFSNTDSLINGARALFALDMFLTYPLELFVARNTIEELFFPKVPARWVHILLTFGLISATTMIGVLTCDLGLVFDLSGGMAASTIAFIFPSACTIKLRGGKIFQRSNIIHIICITFGIFVLVLTTTTTIYDALYEPSSVTCKFINF